MFFDYEDLLNVLNVASTYVAELGVIIFENKSQVYWVFWAALCAFTIIMGARGMRLLKGTFTLQAKALRFFLGNVPFYSGAGLTFFVMIYGLLCIFYNSYLNKFVTSNYTQNVIFAGTNVWKAFLISLVFSFLFSFAFWRRFEPRLANFLADNINKQLVESVRSDVKDLNQLLPQLIKYKPLTYIKVANKDQKIFWGLGADKKPITTPFDSIQSKNTAVIGPPGTGKTVVMANVSVQDLKLGNCVIVFDPKGDEHCPQILKETCDREGLPFFYLDLNADSPQCNPLRSANESEVRELLENVLSLHEQGGDSDFYRLNDRKGLKIILDGMHEFTLSHISSIARSKLGSFADKCPSLISKLEELAQVRSSSAIEDAKFESVLVTGGCLYVKGSMRSARVKMIQTLLLARLIQLVESRLPCEGPNVLFALDEVKFLMSKTLLDSFGVVRSKRARFIIAFQSLSDTSTPTCGVNEKIASQTILDNCQIRLIYRTKSPDVAEWAERQTGTTLVQNDIRDVDISNEAAEITSQEYQFSKVEVPYIDKNSILHLPDMCALCIGIEEAKLLFTSPIAYEPRVLEVMRFAPVLTNVKETLL